MASTLDTHAQYCPCDDCRAERNAIAYSRNHPDEAADEQVDARRYEVRDDGANRGGIGHDWRNRGRYYDLVRK